MDLKQFVTDDDAVSPVIGVILMVAITVILAAVIGAFVLDLGGSQDTAPSVTWEYSYDSSTNDVLTISHNGGDQVKRSTLSVSIGGSTAYEDGAAASSDYSVSSNWATTITAGGSLEIADNAGSPSGASGGNIQGDDEVQIVWASPDSGTTSVIGSYTIPS